MARLKMLSFNSAQNVIQSVSCRVGRTPSVLYVPSHKNRKQVQLGATAVARQRERSQRVCESSHSKRRMKTHWHIFNDRLPGAGVACEREEK